VFYHPHAYAIGFRDVIAAWLVCLAVAATGVACATLAAAPERRLAGREHAAVYLITGNLKHYPRICGAVIIVNAREFLNSSPE